MLPALSVPAGTLNVASPLERVCWLLHVPMLRVADPVGMGWPLVPLTATVTLTVWALVTFVKLGVTDTVAAALPTGAATDTVEDCVAVV